MAINILELIAEFRKSILAGKSDLSIQSKIQEEVRKINDPKIIKNLGQLLQDEDEEPFIRCTAAKVLGIAGDKSIVDTLIHVLQSDDNEEVRYYVADALGNIGDKTAVMPLLQILQTPFETADDPRVYSHIVNSLKLIGDPIAIPVLIKALTNDYGMFEHESSDYRGFIRTALIELGDRNTAKQLMNLLATPYLNPYKYIDNDIRQIISRVLGKLGFDVAIPALIDLLNNPNYDYRCSAAMDLGHFDDPNVIKALLSHLEDADEDLRFCIQNVLKDMGHTFK